LQNVVAANFDRPEENLPGSEGVGVSVEVAPETLRADGSETTVNEGESPQVPLTHVPSDVVQGLIWEAHKLGLRKCGARAIGRRRGILLCGAGAKGHAGSRDGAAFGAERCFCSVRISKDQ
jgi:hypothetical protein